MKIKFPIIFLLLIFSTWEASAQKTMLERYDSLLNVTETDTGKINVIVFKLDIISTINLDSAIDLAQKTLADAQRLNYYRGEVNIMTNLLNNYSYKGNFEAASKILNELQHIIKPTNDSADFAALYSSTGMFYGIQSKYDSSIYFYKKSIRIYERTDNKVRLGTSYANIAIGYQQQSNFPMALQYQQKALKVHEETNNERSQAYALVNMANTYNNLGDFKRAESTFLETINLAKKLNLGNVELYAYSNLASMYVDMEDWQKSYDYAIQAADLGSNFGDPAIEAASLAKASTALVNMDQPEKAEVLSEKAILLADSSSQPLNINQAYSSMGYALLSQERWKEAIPFYEKGFESIKDADLYTTHIGRVTKQLSECYENTGDYAKALELYKKSTAINDSVSQKENIRKATEQTMTFEFEKKEQAEKVRQDSKDEIMQARQIALIISLALSVLLIIGAFIGYYNKQKANTLLSDQKMEIENTLTKLRNTQSQLIQSEKMASLGELTAGIAHEIQNPLNFVNNFSEVSVDLVEELDEELETGNTKEIKAISEDLKQNLGKILHHGNRASGIVRGMLEHSRAGSGEKISTDINKLADEYLRLAYHGLRAKDKSFNADFKLEADANLPKVTIVPQDIGRVLLNLINNAFYVVSEKAKENPENYKPKVIVKTELSPLEGGRGVTIRVKDNGPGIPDNIKDKIFQPFFTTKATGEGTGLGLSLSYDIITKGHGGELTVESNAGEGTQFIIQLPIS